MPKGRIKTRRWNDPAERGDGARLLVCRYRPRALRKEDETWDEWWKDLAPSPELLAAFHGKHGRPIGWEMYVRRYLREMKGQTGRISELAQRVRQGDTVTLLCSSACTEPEHCHRTLLKGLVENALRDPCPTQPISGVRTAPTARRPR
jgi:uncharacterized protein YeaO (DUF488 family)